jgi:glycosyltransferase involved in cell wall biosynthesis
MCELSLIIPSWKDPNLHKTIRSILDNFVTDFEIIPVIDGYELQEPLPNDSRVKPLFLKENGGMRNAINQGVKVANGKYLMRSDEHVKFAYGFDHTILSTIEPNWIVDAKRYFLDVEKWEVMDLEPVVMERLIISKNHNKFSGLVWREADNDIPIKRKQAMQGSFWCMPHAWWDTVIGELQEEGYGKLYQDSTEMTMKTWKAGGELMSNQETWYAHKHRSFNRTHNYSNKEARKSWDYALEQWGDYYKNELLPKWRLQYSI